MLDSTFLLFIHACLFVQRISVNCYIVAMLTYLHSFAATSTVIIPLLAIFYHCTRFFLFLLLSFIQVKEARKT